MSEHSGENVPCPTSAGSMESRREATSNQKEWTASREPGTKKPVLEAEEEVNTELGVTPG